MGQRYEYGIDFDRVEAIDVHTHVEVDGTVTSPTTMSSSQPPADTSQWSQGYFGTDCPYIQIDRWRRDFDTLDVDPAVLPLL
ncbi:hypothetical protein [Mycolicibacterium sp. CR10]|uniref:hypothetical protein n=1 Tax=Mycolicibacterium sp. CR10 TaxID=2562314 RepID=UPI003516AF97